MFRRNFLGLLAISGLLPIPFLKMGIIDKNDRNDKNNSNKRRMLFEIVRKVLGKDTLNYSSEIYDFTLNGDRAAFSCKNAVEYLQAVQILLGEQQEFKSVYVPYIYYASRTLDPESKKDQDGSSLYFTVNAIKQGVLSSDDQKSYFAAISRKWGNGDLNNIPGPDIHIVKSYKKIDNVNDIARSVYHGYPVVLGSEAAFEVLTNKYGFHELREDSWPHDYTVIGFESHPKYGLYFILLDAWGDVHGTLKDFKTEENLPEGALRVGWETMVKVINQSDKEVYAISPYEDFPARASEIDKAMKG